MANIRVGTTSISDDSRMFALGSSADYISTHLFAHMASEYLMYSSEYSEKHHPSVFTLCIQSHSVLLKSHS